jgi:hypothetical protein
LKIIKVSDEVHRKLTQLLGEQIAITGKMQTYNDVIEDLLSQLPVKKDENASLPNRQK